MEMEENLRVVEEIANHENLCGKSVCKRAQYTGLLHFACLCRPPSCVSLQAAYLGRSAPAAALSLHGNAWNCMELTWNILLS